MSNDLTELVCVIDRSGSMKSIQMDAIGGFNAFLDSQKALPGDAYLTLVLFDHDYERVLDGVSIAEVSPLTVETYVPRGTTALLDAVGRTLVDVADRISTTPKEERPESVLVCILTDGMENASSDFTRDRVRTLIEEKQREQGWEFQFLAANQGAFAEAGRLGIDRSDSAGFVADAAGTARAFAVIGERSSRLREKRS